jgi:hypothetical protein
LIGSTRNKRIILKKQALLTLLKLVVTIIGVLDQLAANNSDFDRQEKNQLAD